MRGREVERERRGGKRHEMRDKQEMKEGGLKMEGGGRKVMRGKREEEGMEQEIRRQGRQKQDFI